MPTRKQDKVVGTTVSRRHQMLHRRHCQQTVQDTLCRLDNQKDLFLRDMAHKTERMKEELALSRANLSNLAKYYENNDFKKLVTDITDEERARQYYNSLLEVYPPTTESVCLHRHSCPLYPCQRMRSYHFMFRNVSDINRIQKVDLVSPSNGKTGDGGDKTHISQTRTKEIEDKFKKGRVFNREKGVKELPSNSVNLTRKEIFLRCAVLRRRLQDSNRKFIVHAVNYGKQLPWRALKKPAMLDQTHGTEFGSGRRILAF